MVSKGLSAAIREPRSSSTVSFPFWKATYYTDKEGFYAKRVKRVARRPSFDARCSQPVAIRYVIILILILSEA